MFCRILFLIVKENNESFDIGKSFLFGLLYCRSRFKKELSG